MDDKGRLRFMKVFGVALVAFIILIIVSIFITESQAGFSPTLLIILLPAAAIIITLLLNVKNLSRGVKSGLPLRDEMSERIKERAGYLSLMATLYFVLGLMFYHGILVEDYGFPGLVVRHAMIVVLIFIIGSFGLIWFIMNRRGEV
jgi:hypothetical protein